jgi:nitrogen fixation protein NifU and related proteins
VTDDTISMDELRELYRELILDHARSPRHFGKLDGMTHTAEGINPLCGDKLRIYFRVGQNDTIEDAAFEGTGCAISVASASLLTDTVIGMPIPKAMEFFGVVTETLAGRAPDLDLDLGKLRALEGVREFPSRVKCATLAWHAMRSALSESDKPASTE